MQFLSKESFMENANTLLYLAITAFIIMSFVIYHTYKNNLITDYFKQFIANITLSISVFFFSLSTISLFLSFKLTKPESFMNLMYASCIIFLFSSTFTYLLYFYNKKNLKSNSLWFFGELFFGAGISIVLLAISIYFSEGWILNEEVIKKNFSGLLSTNDKDAIKALTNLRVSMLNFSFMISFLFISVGLLFNSSRLKKHK